MTAVKTHSQAQREKLKLILDTDLHRCTQIQKPMNPIALGEKKTG
jgi:hypothetical protein